MSLVRGVAGREYEQMPAMRVPVAFRALQGLIAVGSVAVVGFAIWIGVREQTPPSDLVTVDSATTAGSVNATVSSVPGVSDAVATSAATTSVATISDPTVTPPVTIAEVAGMANATLLRSAPLASEPGTAGLTMSRNDVVALTGSLTILGDSTWLEVERDGDVGWTEASAVKITTTDFGVRPCATLPASIPSRALAYQPGTAVGTADGIAWIEQHQSETCSRLVLYLADRLATAEAKLSDAFPTDLSVIDLGGRVRVELSQDLLVVPEFSLGTVSVSGGEAVTIAALRADGRLAFNIDPGPARMAISFLANPARVVLDLVQESDVSAGVGGGVIVNAQSMVDAISAGDGSVVTVTGFARLGDGLGEIALRRAPADDAAPGTGLAVDAQFEGTPRAGTVTRSWYFYQTPQFDGQWTEFRFSFAGLTPGIYEMFLGLGSAPPEDVETPGLFQLFSVEAPG